MINENLNFFDIHAKYVCSFLKMNIPEYCFRIKVEKIGQSEINAVIITNSEYCEIITQTLSNYYKELYPSLDSTKFRMNANMFIIENFEDDIIGKIKLEYTILNSKYIPRSHHLLQFFQNTYH